MRPHPMYDVKDCAVRRTYFELYNIGIGRKWADRCHGSNATVSHTATNSHMASCWQASFPCVVSECDVCITYITSHAHTLPTHTMKCYFIYIIRMCICWYSELQYLYWCDAMASFIPYILAASIFSGWPGNRVRGYHIHQWTLWEYKLGIPDSRRHWILNL